eukprot:4167104-Alexandrium_andersonii.AAC.1
MGNIVKHKLPGGVHRPFPNVNARNPICSDAIEPPRVGMKAKRHGTAFWACCEMPATRPRRA